MTLKAAVHFHWMEAYNLSASVLLTIGVQLNGMSKSWPTMVGFCAEQLTATDLQVLGCVGSHHHERQAGLLSFRVVLRR